MKLEIPDAAVNALRLALGPLIERLIEEKVEQRRPLLLTVAQVADELACSRASVYGLIRGGHLEAVPTGRTYRIATDVLDAYVAELTKPTFQREVVSAHRLPSRRSARITRPRQRDTPAPPPVRPATRPTRAPRPKTSQGPSKEDVANERWTVDEFARWWGKESAEAAFEMSGIDVRDEDGTRTFRYGDVIEWTTDHPEQFRDWLERFDPVLNRSRWQQASLDAAS